MKPLTFDRAVETCERETRNLERLVNADCWKFAVGLAVAGGIAFLWVTEHVLS